jgi:hypothetical protein
MTKVSFKKAGLAYQSGGSGSSDFARFGGSVAIRTLDGSGEATGAQPFDGAPNWEFVGSEITRFATE